MGRHSFFIAALFALVTGNPALAKQATEGGQAGQSAATQAKARSAREATQMSYSRDARQASTSGVVDQFTRARNERGGTTMNITMASGR